MFTNPGRNFQENEAIIRQPWLPSAVAAIPSSRGAPKVGSQGRSPDGLFRLRFLREVHEGEAGEPRLHRFDGAEAFEGTP